MTSTYKETQRTINEWQREHFPDATLAGVRNHLRLECTEFFDAVGTQAQAFEAADIIILLYCWAMHKDIDLHSFVDAKMAINRAREWNIQTDGTGRHVKE